MIYGIIMSGKMCNAIIYEPSGGKFWILKRVWGLTESEISIRKMKNYNSILSDFHFEKIIFLTSWEKEMRFADLMVVHIYIYIMYILGAWFYSSLETALVNFEELLVYF